MTIGRQTVRTRWRQIHSALDSADVDVLLVSDRFNFAYLTTRSSREFEKRFRHLVILLDRNGDGWALAPASEAGALRSAVPDLRLQVYESEPLDVRTAAGFIAGASSRNPRRLGVELSGADRPDLTGSMLRAVMDLMPASAMVDCSPILSRARLLKSAEEIGALRLAGAIAQSAWEATLPKIQPGMTLAEVSGHLASGFAEHGADYNFPGHIEARNASDLSSPILRPGHVLWCDFGVTIDGYHSDVSRRAVLGPPASSQIENHRNGVGLLEAFIGALRPDRPIDDATRDMLRIRSNLHHGDDLPRRFGHGIGLCAAEPPSRDVRHGALLERGTVVTPEPSFTAADGEFVHLEEMVVIGADGGVPITSGAATLYQAG